MTASVSVVIPTYKGVPFIKEALESVFSQTVPPTEIIVSDDCSPDATLDVVHKFANRATVPLRVLRASRNSGGPGRPLNAGIRAARGELIAVLEQDDVMKSGRIEKQLHALGSFPASKLSIGRIETRVSAAESLPEWLWPERQFEHVDLRDLDGTASAFLIRRREAIAGLARSNYLISNSNLMFFKSLWGQIGGFSERVKTCADYDFMTRAVCRTDVAVVNEAIIEYRFRSASLNRQNAQLTHQESLAVHRSFILKYPELCGESYWSCYWGARGDAWRRLRRGSLYSALRLYWQLVWSGALFHHLRAKRGSDADHTTKSAICH